MVVEIILLLSLSVITARFLEKRYRIASIAHSVLFIFLCLVYLFTTPFQPIVDMCIRWIGEIYYQSLHEALLTPVFFMNLSLSALFMFELVTFILIPLFTITILVKKIKEECENLRTNALYIEEGYKEESNDYSYDYIEYRNDRYLIFESLLN